MRRSGAAYSLPPPKRASRSACGSGMRREADERRSDSAMKSHTRRTGVAAAAVALMITPASSQPNDPPYRNRTLPVEKRVDDLLGRMTLDEKIGQMTQADH